MEKFKKELEEEKNPWIKRIGNYLLSREDLRENLKKPKKTLKECFNYILVELSKQCERQGNVGYVAGDDEEIFGLAVHYYDEDDIVVGKKNFSTNADGSATRVPGASSEHKAEVKKTKNTSKAEIDKAVEKALNQYKAEEAAKKAEAKKKKQEEKSKKASSNDAQMDIFNFLG